MRPWMTEDRTCPLCNGSGRNVVFRLPGTAEDCERCEGSGVVLVRIVDPDWQRPDPLQVQKDRDDLQRAEGWWPTLSRVFLRFWNAGAWTW